MQAAAFAPLLTAPAPVVAAVAAVLGMPGVAVAAVPLAAWHTSLVRSSSASTENRRLAARGAGLPLRLATVNLRRLDGPVPAMADRLAGLDADVVLVQELTPASAPSFGHGRFAERFAHRFEAPEDGFFGSGAYSRHPLIAGDDRPLGGRHMGVVLLDVGGRRVTVVSVHTQAPIHRRDIEPWRSGFTHLAALAVAVNAGGPVILAGDWNATTGHRPLRRLLRTADLLDAHLAVGRGRARTWPAGGRLPPLLLLDRVLVGGGVAVRAVGEHRVPGSDHLAVVADLTVPLPPARPR